LPRQAPDVVKKSTATDDDASKTEKLN